MSWGAQTSNHQRTQSGFKNLELTRDFQINIAQTNKLILVLQQIRIQEKVLAAEYTFVNTSRDRRIHPFPLSQFQYENLCHDDN